MPRVYYRAAPPEIGRTALADRTLGADCVRHARLFFDRPDYDLAAARPRSFAIAPVAGMVDALRRDYDLMAAMIFDVAPSFADILESMKELDALANK